jgi:hypothetical protein
MDKLAMATVERLLRMLDTNYPKDTETYSTAYFALCSLSLRQLAALEVLIVSGKLMRGDYDDEGR